MKDVFQRLCIAPSNRRHSSSFLTQGSKPTGNFEGHRIAFKRLRERAIFWSRRMGEKQFEAGRFPVWQEADRDADDVRQLQQVLIVCAQDRVDIAAWRTVVR